MIDKINGNGSYDFPDSQKRKNQAVRAYENTPGSKEAAQRNAAGIRKKKNAHAAAQKDSGVILDLSGNAASQKRKLVTAGQRKESSWVKALRRLVAPVVQWLKEFWSSEEKQPDADALQDLELPPLDADADVNADMDVGMDTDMNAGLVQEEIGQEPAVQDVSGTVDRIDAAQEENWKLLADQAVKSGDLKQMERFLTQNGTKRLAHNSDLLTYYDRRGKFVEMDETEKHRVLFGDKNVLKL